MIETQEERIFMNELGITIKPWILLVAKMAALAKGSRLVDARMECSIDNTKNNDHFFIRMTCSENGEKAWRDYRKSGPGEVWFKLPLGEESQLFLIRADAIFEEYQKAEARLAEAREAKIKSGEIVTKTEQK